MSRSNRMTLYEDDRTNPIIHDQHTINASTGNLTKVEVVNAFTRTMDEALKKYGIQSAMYTNYVTYYNESLGERLPKGVSYIFFTNPRLYHILLGRNPDGTERVKYIPDPDWKPKKKEQEQEKKEESGKFSSWSDFTSGSIASWADSVEEEEKAPMIRIQEPPLLEPVVYIKDNERIEITVQASFVTIDSELSSEYDIDKLSSFVPVNVTPDDIFRVFKPFSGTKTYPRIKMTKTINKGNRLIFISFDPVSKDALFARQVVYTHTFNGVVCKFDCPRTRGEGKRISDS